MGLFDFLKKKKKETVFPRYLYTEAELDEYEKYIEESFGHYDLVMHELYSPDIHLDVIVIDPDDESPYFRLITMGAGAYKMNVPEEVKGQKLEYAEYMIYLPADWNINSSDEKDYWPIRYLKNAARIPVVYDSWMAYGHTVAGEGEKCFAENTGFNSVMLVMALDNNDQQATVRLSSGKHINFYQLIPLYPEELEIKKAQGADSIVDLLAEQKGFPVVDINRKNTALKQ